jgi:host cell surface-exposed lipoprotein
MLWDIRVKFPAAEEPKPNGGVSGPLRRRVQALPPSVASFGFEAPGGGVGPIPPMRFAESLCRSPESLVDFPPTWWPVKQRACVAHVCQELRDYADCGAMKKISILAIALVLWLVACGTPTTANTSAARGEAQASTTDAPTNEEAPATRRAPTTTTTTKAPATTTTAAPATTTTAAPTTTTTTPPEPQFTRSEENAIRSAESYLDYTAFSRSGLIEQLEYEGFNTGEATLAVDYLTVDWNEQAWKSAESYLDYTAFSRSGLIDQLLYEGFTLEQATYGVDKTGL